MSNRRVPAHTAFGLIAAFGLALAAQPAQAGETADPFGGLPVLDDATLAAWAGGESEGFSNSANVEAILTDNTINGDAISGMIGNNTISFEGIGVFLFNTAPNVVLNSNVQMNFNLP